VTYGTPVSVRAGTPGHHSLRKSRAAIADPARSSNSANFLVFFVDKIEAAGAASTKMLDEPAFMDIVVFFQENARDRPLHLQKHGSCYAFCHARTYER
jgi:hypothetical protein